MNPLTGAFQEIIFIVNKCSNKQNITKKSVFLACRQMERTMKITVLDTEISVQRIGNEDYISLTDMARSQLQEHIIFKWLSNKNTIESGKPSITRILIIPNSVQLKMPQEAIISFFQPNSGFYLPTQKELLRNLEDMAERSLTEISLTISECGLVLGFNCSSYMNICV